MIRGEPTIIQLSREKRLQVIRDASGYMHDSIVLSSFLPIEDSFFESSSTAERRPNGDLS